MIGPGYGRVSRSVPPGLALTADGRESCHEPLEIQVDRYGRLCVVLGVVSDRSR